MAKTPVTREPAEPILEEALKTIDNKVELVEGLEVVSETIPSSESDKDREARAERVRADVLATKSGPVTLPPPELVGVKDVMELATEVEEQQAPVDEPVYEHLVTKRRRMDDDRVLKGEGPLVDGARYNVIVRMEGPDAHTPLYVTDAMTGERLPTHCTVLEKRGEQWYGQMHTRVGGAVETHQGMDPIHLIVVPA